MWFMMKLNRDKIQDGLKHRRRLLKRNDVHFVTFVPTFRRNRLPRMARQDSEPCDKRDVRFLRNTGTYTVPSYTASYPTNTKS